MDEKRIVLYKDENVAIEKIISFGNITRDSFWYEQKENEMVYILEGEGEIEFSCGKKIFLNTATEIIIEKGVKHRVSYTSLNPPCVWLCVFYENKLDNLGYANILYKMFKLSNEKYKEFHNKLVKSDYDIMGIKSPNMFNLAKELYKLGYDKIINSLKHKYIEECMLHGILLSFNKNDIKLFIEDLNKFLPYIDNWAVCDTCVSKYKIIKKHKQIILKQCELFIKSNEPFVQRVGIVILLAHDYFNDEYINPALNLLLNVISHHYYVNMALSWAYSVALLKNYDKTLEILKNKLIKNKWVHNKAIQKARESFRITAAQKDELNLLKIS